MACFGLRARGSRARGGVCLVLLQPRRFDHALLSLLCAVGIIIIIARPTDRPTLPRVREWRSRVLLPPCGACVCVLCATTAVAELNVRPRTLIGPFYSRARWAGILPGRRTHVK